METISEKPRYIEKNLEKRIVLHLTIAINHDVIDGGSATQFVSKLIEIMEKGCGL